MSPSLGFHFSVPFFEYIEAVNVIPLGLEYYIGKEGKGDAELHINSSW